MDNTFDDLRSRVTLKLATLQLKAEEIWGDKFEDGLAPDFKISFNLKGNRAGTAQYSKSGNHELRFNRRILMENGEKFLEDTVPHELAHLITYALYGVDRDYKGHRRIKPHGTEWQNVMRKLGYKPTRCHNFDVEPARKVAKKYRYSCGCKEYHLTAIRHNKILGGKSSYSCTRCGRKLARMAANTTLAKRDPYVVQL
jgi:SprT protein